MDKPSIGGGLSLVGGIASVHRAVLSDHEPVTEITCARAAFQMKIPLAIRNSLDCWRAEA